MSDFLVSLGGSHTGADLLELLGVPYGARHPEGEYFDHSWGSVAVLRDPVARKSNICHCAQGILAWIGDLIMAKPERVAAGLCQRVRALTNESTDTVNLLREEDFAALNGAFAAVLVSPIGPAVITDPLGSVQVYAACNRQESICTLGTHPDLVATISNEEDEIDPVSVFEFINAGTPCFPHTMYKRVHELAPGHLHVVSWNPNGTFAFKSAAWWPFPDELEKLPDERELAASLGAAFKAAVQDRCHDGIVGVTLSGGLDSRLVMAAVPESTRCIGFTFCDVLNREARIARKVARCYGRQWVPLCRDEDYIARNALDTIKFIGCEGDWVNAHGLGFVEQIERYEVGTVLTGLLMNNNVKGYYAADIQRVPRWGGLLPPKFEIAPYDYVSELKAFRSNIFAPGLLEAARSRRENFLKHHPGMKRQSVAEWLDGYPFSQAPDNTAWVAERRLMPVRVPAMDRRLLDISCRIPMSAKAGGRLFTHMAVNILGKGARIPNANDGVRPGSKHLSRLLQRAVRKAENNARDFCNGAGLTLHVPTSWHDYQRYWRESRLLQQLIAENAKNLEDLEDTVFQMRPRELVNDLNLSWEHGFRLVQLGLWKSILRQYKLPATTGERLIP